MEQSEEACLERAEHDREAALVTERDEREGEVLEAGGRPIEDRGRRRRAGHHLEKKSGF